MIQNRNLLAQLGWSQELLEAFDAISDSLPDSSAEALVSGFLAEPEPSTGTAVLDLAHAPVVGSSQLSVARRK